MNKFLRHRVFLTVLRIVLGAIFVYSGALKLTDPLSFADSIDTFKVVPPQIVNLVALGLPPFEILVGALLMFGCYKRQASLTLFALIAVFMIFLFQALLRGLEVDCGCFGGGEPSAWSAWISLGRNILLLAGCGWIYAFSSVPSPRSERPETT